MKKFAIVMCFAVLVAGLAIAAEKPVMDPIDFSQLKRVPCNLTSVAIDWDFAINDQGFTTTTCDPTGGGTGDVWQWGTDSLSGAAGTVWGTVLDANYPNDVGQGLISPTFSVTPTSDLMEISHWVHIETNFDGGNVTVADMVIPPTDGYPATISTSTSFYAWCVDNEEGFTGNGSSGPSEVWTQRCFDLSAYNGQDIQVRFDFGSDSSVTYPGWYLAYVRIGDDFVPVELQSFDID